MEERSPLLTDASVARYLKNHPHFFEQHADLLLELKITHRSGDAISLVQKQLELLRERCTRQQSTLENAIEIAQENSSLFELTKNLTLKLLEAKNVRDFMATLDESIRQDFNADAIKVLCNTQHLDIEQGAMHALIQLQHNRHCDAYCGLIEPEERKILFPHTPSIQSCIKIVLNFKTDVCSAQQGLLVIGSRKADYFGGSKDTLFLEFIGSLIERLLPHCLEISQGSEA